MTYGLKEFSELHKLLKEKLTDERGDPLSCRLYECAGARGSIDLVDENGCKIDHHIAEACNIAGQIKSLRRLLSLPRSHVACADLSEVFLINLDVLRTHIRAASASDRYQESEADAVIRRWAGFLKHPCDYVFAHKCLFRDYPDTDPPTITITSSFLKEWDGLNGTQKDRKKAELANRIVAVQLPTIDELSSFFDACASHLTALVDAARRAT
ncbi:hypothetical protein F8A10_07630 [Paracoccus kondratievae]|uniref:hypothetical protein n=1 Tax=Paracoccus kondratievae TaxID=135740 RepID=UPI0012663DBA|nr:hypothetical protein [Paracoccus kondratievae]QFQ87303.1 hypothetical protein F8A10_07630 [Paracoccus kondratievae]